MRLDGVADDARAERILIDRLRLIATTMSAGCDFAVMHTEHHGIVNLFDMAGYPPRTDDT